MSQINFRLNPDEKYVLQVLADLKGISIAEYSKQVILRDIKDLRKNLAFDLLQQKKISKKRAFVLSGLSYHEFMGEWAKIGIEDDLPEEIIEKELEIAKNINIANHLKKKFD